MTYIVTIIERMPRVVHNKKWDDEKIERLRRLAATGIGETAIARQFTEHYKTLFTRNMVIGARFRYKIACHSRSINKPERTKEQQLYSRSAMTKIQHRRAAGNQEAKPVMLIEPVTPVADLAIPLGQRCTLLELDDGKCHWPVGCPGTPGFFFCGGKIEGKRTKYCGYHTRIGIDRQPWRGARLNTKF